MALALLRVSMIYRILVFLTLASWAACLQGSLAQEYVPPEYCTSEKLEEAEAAVKYPKKWDRRLAEITELKAAQGAVDDAPPDTFDQGSFTSPPIPDFPASVVSRGRSVRAACRILHDVEADGTASNIIVACSKSNFKGTARTAVAAARFIPAFQDGVPVTRYGIISPLVFCLAL